MTEQNSSSRFTPPLINSGSGEISIVKKLYDFYRDLHEAILLFPKLDRYTLGQSLQGKSLQLIETVLLASRLSRPTKKDLLLKANSQLDLLKLLLRMACETKAINQKKYILLENYLQEAGKMLGGWLRSLN